MFDAPTDVECPPARTANGQVGAMELALVSTRTTVETSSTDLGVTMQRGWMLACCRVKYDPRDVVYVLFPGYETVLLNNRDKARHCELECQVCDLVITEKNCSYASAHNVRDVSHFIEELEELSSFSDFVQSTI